MSSAFLTQPIAQVMSMKNISAGHPVYLLEMPDDSFLIIKNDSGTASAIQNNLNTMAAVSAKSGGSVLADAEMKAVINYVVLEKEYAAKNLKPINPDITMFENHMRAHGTWFKMENVPGFTDLKSAVQDLQNNGNYQGVRAIGKALNAPDGFETLGQVIAADFFNQNRDRFYPNSSAGATDGGQNPTTGGRFRVVQNYGNIMISVDKKKNRTLALDKFLSKIGRDRKKERTVLGLDSYDPSTAVYMDMSKTVAQIENAGGDPWDGKFLRANPKDNQRREELCDDIFTDLDELLGPWKKSKLSLSKKRLDKDGGRRLRIGVEEGSEKIMKHLNLQIAQGNAPVGIRDRLAVMSA